MSTHTFWSFYTIPLTFPWPRNAPSEWNDSLNRPHVFEGDVRKQAASSEHKNAYCRELCVTLSVSIMKCTGLSVRLLHLCSSKHKDWNSAQCFNRKVWVVVFHGTFPHALWSAFTNKKDYSLLNLELFIVFFLIYLINNYVKLTQPNPRHSPIPVGLRWGCNTQLLLFI